MVFAFPHRIFIALTLSLFCNLNAWSVVTFQSASGVSGYEAVEKVINIYAGMAYAPGLTPATLSCPEVGVCDTCTGTLSACSHRSIFPETTLTLSVSVDKLVAGSKLNVCYNNINKTANGQESTSGTSFTWTITWSSLCGDILENPLCGTSKAYTMSVGYGPDSQSCATDDVDLKIFLSSYKDAPVYASNSTQALGEKAAVSFKLFPGDEKVYLLPEYFKFTDAAPAVGGTGLLWSNILFFYKEGADLTGIVNNSLSAAIPVDATDGTLAHDYIDGLTNEVKFCFRMASQDNTGVIRYFSPDPPDSNLTDVCEMPSEVVGLLSDKKCFIATAAFGSNLDPHVTAFRKFRNEFLLPSTVGKYFVKTYYKFSPPLAQFIQNHDWLRTAVRLLLWPLLYFVEMSLAWGLWVTLCISMILIFVTRGLFKKFLRPT